MANWSNILITNIGATKLSVAIAGEELVFTRIAIGDDRQAGNASLVTAMKSEVAHTSPVSVKANGNKVSIRGAFLSEFISTSFYMKEIGLFASINAGPEFLIAYGTALDTNGDWIDALSPNTSIERVFEFAITISTDASVSIAIDPLALATKADIIDFLKIEDLQDGLKDLNALTVEVADYLSTTDIYSSAAGLSLYANDVNDNAFLGIKVEHSTFADTSTAEIHASMPRLHVTNDAYIENMRSPSLSSGCAWSYDGATSSWTKSTARKYGEIGLELSTVITEGVLFATITFDSLAETMGIVFTHSTGTQTVDYLNLDNQKVQIYFALKGSTSLVFRVDGWSPIPSDAKISFFIM